MSTPAVISTPPEDLPEMSLDFIAQTIAHNPPPRLLLQVLTLATIAAELVLAVAVALAVR
jgi:hypothetical protein